ncbi:BioY protein [Ferroglobus placidus DSM 10642]|uniref:BioY protein n=1 Tax=Ferroglobus placidus (strain DSM 10642 / AEDII12DO) TaxID=589924 RepID=D3RZ71_FERPA|nr:biotin transporter BioY [Ferroglobus placidus]ADC65784.1 BioY protein [Ferroglobus placidus DSM 10642]
MVDYKKVSFIIASALIIAASAQINFKLGPVPYTMQNFGVMLAGFLLGKQGFLAVILYLALIALGLPFAAGGGGLGVLLGPTSGFLYGFVISALLAGIFREVIWKKGDRREIVLLWLSTFLASIPIYLLGFIVFYKFALANEKLLAWAEKAAEFFGFESTSPAVLLFFSTVLIFIPQDFFVDHLLAVLVFKYVWEMLRERGVEVDRA